MFANRIIHSIDDFIKHHYMPNDQLFSNLSNLKNMDLLFIHQPHVSDKVLAYYSFKLDWKMVLKYHRLIESRLLLNAFRHSIDWNWLAQNHKLALSMINGILINISEDILLACVDIPDEYIMNNDWKFKWMPLARAGRFESARLLQHYRFRIDYQSLFSLQVPLNIEWCISIRGLTYTHEYIEIMIRHRKLSIYDLRSIVRNMNLRYAIHMDTVTINNYISRCFLIGMIWLNIKR